MKHLSMLLLAVFCFVLIYDSALAADSDANAAVAERCTGMGMLAENIANYRDQGIPLSRVEQSLMGTSVSPDDHLLFIKMAELVYSSDVKPSGVHDAIQNACLKSEAKLGNNVMVLPKLR
ncbi:MAG: hypothetical protein ABSB13_06680 [Candidatus Binatus sp.]|jgi:hypothetical protein|uniref:hypothetical protein n=1 Tax=Candidatus Binatus sp. TaxID=2811406 RepID=UPI003D12F6A4